MEKVIVTVRDPKDTFEYDMELPVNEPCGILARKSAALIKAYDPDAARFLISPVFAKVNGDPVPDNATLAESDVWDGCVLILHDCVNGGV